MGKKTYTNGLVYVGELFEDQVTEIVRKDGHAKKSDWGEVVFNKHLNLQSTV